MSLAIGRILCPVDFSEPSEEALRYGLALAERLGADVEIIHVHQPPTHPLMPSEMTSSLGIDAGVQQRIARELEALAHRYSAHDVAVTHRVLAGVPYETIVETARADGFDLVVIGTHGRGFVRRALVGSVAERVLRLSTVPVCTVVPSPA